MTPRQAKEYQLMLKYLLIAAGGAIGTIFRYLISNLDYKYSNGVFPLGTFMVNISGSLLIGFLWGISEKILLPPKFRLFAFIGILGGYTTFSTYSLESFNLLRDGEYKIALGNIILTNFTCILFVFLGFYLSKVILNLSNKNGFLPCIFLSILLL